MMNMNERTADYRVIEGEASRLDAADSARRVLRNTYMLLSATLGFSAVVAGASVAFGWPHPGLILTLIGFYGLLFAIHKFQDSGAAVGLTFALTGFMGLTIGPIISHYLNLPNGGQTVMMAMGGTAVVFLTLSGLALNTKRDFTGMGSFLTVGMVVVILASLVGIFFPMPLLSLVISAAMVLLMSGMILFETSNIERGGETNYVLATVSLFVSIYNLFLSLLQLLGIFGNDD
jgi:modulator of FtsH protease